MGAQGGEGYAHPVRTLVPVLPVAELVEQGIVKETTLDDLRRFDHLINYMYLPPIKINELEFAMPESLALLYMPVTLHHAFLEGQRVFRSSPIAERSSCSGSSSGSTQAGLRTTSTSSTRRWIELGEKPDDVSLNLFAAVFERLSKALSGA